MASAKTGSEMIEDSSKYSTAALKTVKIDINFESTFLAHWSVKGAVAKNYSGFPYPQRNPL